MSSKMKGFLVYYDNEVIVCRLPDDEAGKLFKSLFPYGKECIKPNFEDTPALAMAFDILSMALDKDKENYEKKCEKNRENIAKRWNKTNTNVYERIPSDTNDTNNNNNNNNNSNINNTICSEPELTPSPSGILIPLNDKSFYDVPLDKIVLWKESYPAVDVEQELKKMVAWSHSNPTKCKTRRGVDRFINNWLAKEQDKGGNKNTRQQSQELAVSDSYAAYHEMYQKYPHRPSPDDPFQ